MNQIQLSDLVIVESKNITFTAAEWAQYAAQANSDTTYFCSVFMMLGAIVGALWVAVGIKWYNGRQG